jgi:hypothetical protein
MCGPFQLLTSLELGRGGRALAAWFGMAGEEGGRRGSDSRFKNNAVGSWSWSSTVSLSAGLRI